MGGVISSVFGDPDMVTIKDKVSETQRQHEAFIAAKRRKANAVHQQLMAENPDFLDHIPNKVLSYLYIGDIGCSTNPAKLKEYGIGYALQLSPVAMPDDFKKKFSDAGVDYLRLPVEDVETDNIIMHFKLAHEFIDRARKAAKQDADETPGVVVFCDQGVSRSVTIVIAYLVKIGFTLKAAIATVKRSRPQAHPNSGFFKQLIEFETTTNGDSTVLESDYTKLFST